LIDFQRFRLSPANVRSALCFETLAGRRTARCRRVNGPFTDLSVSDGLPQVITDEQQRSHFIRDFQPTRHEQQFFRLRVMTQCRPVSIAALLSAVVLFGTVACSSTAARTGTRTKGARSLGLKAVASPACTPKQLHDLNRGAVQTRIRIRSTQPGQANTRKTAVKITRNTLLVVTIRQRGTGHLATTTGCWAKRASHVRRGLMTVAFLMNQAGYVELVTIAAVPPGAEAGARVWHLQVVRH
jgi:hypothetical protein